MLKSQYESAGDSASLPRLTSLLAGITRVKWIIILLNVLALLAALGLRQYAGSSQRHDAEDAYQGLISRGLLDEAKVDAYARGNNGWHARDRLRVIGSPEGFVQLLFDVIVGVCILNSVAILFLTRKKGTHAA